MIPDGHNLSHQHGGYGFIYRPLLPHQRAELRRTTLTLPPELFAAAIYDAIDAQLVSCNWQGGASALPGEVFAETFRIVTEFTPNAKNLFDGACLALEYPHLERTSCRSCMAWGWNPLTGKLHRDSHGNPIRRQEASVLLCQTPAGCPKGTPDKPIEFTPENAAAFHHYQMAGGQGCPDDEIVRHNWAIIKRAEQYVRQQHTIGVRQHPQGYGGAMGGGVRRTGVFPDHVRRPF